MSAAATSFAYVCYIGSKERDIVPVENIKGFTLDTYHSKKKYKIKWVEDEEYYDGHVVFLGDSYKAVATKADEIRPKIVPDSLLISNTSDSDDEEKKKKQNNQIKKSDENKKLLENKLKTLRTSHTRKTDEQGEQIITAEVDNSHVDQAYEKVYQNENNQSGSSARSTTPDNKGVGSNAKRRIIYDKTDEDENKAQPATKIAKHSNSYSSPSLSINTPKQSLRRINPDGSGTSESLKKSADTVRQRINPNNGNEFSAENLKKSADTDYQQIIKKLRQENGDLKLQLQESQFLNVELQKKVISRMGDVQVQLAKLVNKPTNVPLATNESLGTPKVAFVRADDEAVHLGRNIYISSGTYHSVLADAKTPSLFVNHMAQAVFGIPTLKSSTVTGKISNRLIKRGKKQARPKLDETKMLAIEDIYRHWLLNHKNYSQIEVNYLASRMPSIISKKICQLNSEPTKKTAAAVETEEINHPNLIVEDQEELSVKNTSDTGGTIGSDLDEGSEEIVTDVDD